MTFLSTSVTIAGLMLLAHSCYSAQEHATISSTATTHAFAQQKHEDGLPLDIRIETIVATLFLCVGIVSGSERLYPIQWRVWAGKVEREGSAGFRENSGQVDKAFRGNPYDVFESRSGFVDIRRQRREFAAWAKDSAAAR